MDLAEPGRKADDQSGNRIGTAEPGRKADSNLTINKVKFEAEPGRKADEATDFSQSTT